VLLADEEELLEVGVLGFEVADDAGEFELAGEFGGFLVVDVDGGLGGS
jgi:hypothetical protein